MTEMMPPGGDGAGPGAPGDQESRDAAFSRHGQDHDSDPAAVARAVGTPPGRGEALGGGPAGGDDATGGSDASGGDDATGGSDAAGGGPAGPPPLADVIDPGWAAALAPVEPRLRELGNFLRAEVRAGRTYLPAPGQVLRAFHAPLSQVRVLIVGQDPYPTPGHPVGLSFSVAPDVRPLPGSLRNIFTELVADLGCDSPTTGDLTPWTERGVLLLNRVLTVAPGEPGSHRGRGWEQITDAAIAALVARGGPLVAVLWGRDAQSLVPRLGSVPYVASVHPSPLSAHRGFLGSRPFSRVNEMLTAQGAEPIDWRLP